MAVKLDYFEGMVKSINKRYGFNFEIGFQNSQIELKSKKGRVFGTDNPTLFESALKSLKKEGVISHNLLQERKDYQAFIKQKTTEGVNPKVANKLYFESII